MAYKVQIANGLVGFNYPKPIQILKMKFTGDAEIEVVPEDCFAVYIQNELYVVLNKEQVIGDFIRYKGKIAVQSINIASKSEKRVFKDGDLKHTNYNWEDLDTNWEDLDVNWEDWGADESDNYNLGSIKQIVTFTRGGKKYVQPKRLDAKIQDYTSLNNKHKHSYILDIEGNGYTSLNDGHRHRVINYRVQMAHKHSHKIGRKARNKYGVN